MACLGAQGLTSSLKTQNRAAKQKKGRRKERYALPRAQGKPYPPTEALEMALTTKTLAAWEVCEAEEDAPKGGHTARQMMRESKWLARRSPKIGKIGKSKLECACTNPAFGFKLQTFAFSFGYTWYSRTGRPRPARIRAH